MSTPIHEIDPRLRDTPSQTVPLSAIPQRPSSTDHDPQAGGPPLNLIPLLPHQLHPFHPLHQSTPLQSPIQNQLQSPYTSNTPQSASHIGDHEVGSIDDGGQGDPKRARACEACRGLKVKCEPDLTNPSGGAPCKRCAKAGRPCVVHPPSRKRQKKTDNRIAELEKKINSLTATLQATNSGSVAQVVGNGLQNELLNLSAQGNPYQQVTNGSFNPQGSPYPSPAQVPGAEWSSFIKPTENGKHKDTPIVLAGQKRKHSGNPEYGAMYPNSTESQVRKDDGVTLHDQVKAAWASSNPETRAPQTHEYSDVIDRGLLTADMADQIFECYVEKMAPHLPAVVLPVGTTSSKVRKESPTLFLAILAAASGSNYPELQKPLTKEVMTVYADRIVISGDKSLELVQALHISTLWYWPPENFEELKFYQLIHIAAVMALDIGMGKAIKSSRFKNAGLFRDNPWRKQPFPDPESVEARRAWLTCYFLCCNTSMGLRRPNLIRWSTWMDDCIEVLENSADAAPTDKLFCQWIRSQHIAEEIGNQFSMDDPAAKVSISDVKVQYALKGFERDLENWNRQVPIEAQSLSLKLTEHVVNLYMHEIAMHVDHNVDEFKPPYSEETLRGLGDGSAEDALTPHHVAALSICLQSIDGIFDTFLRFDAETVRCLPVANFVRVAYAVVVLIKMYFAASSPNSGVGKVFDKDNMKVEEYLNGLVALFNASAADNKSRPAAKFLMVLTMLKTWFFRQKHGKSNEPTRDAATAMTLPTAGPGVTQTVDNQQERQGYAPTNTPLQLLSELATGNSSGQARNENDYAGPPDEWNQVQPPPSFAHFGNGLTPNYLGGIDPNLGADFNYTIGEGFEQAIGYTLAGFAPYLGDDAFFTGVMGSMPGMDGA